MRPSSMQGLLVRTSGRYGDADGSRSSVQAAIACTLSASSEGPAR